VRGAESLFTLAHVLAGTNGRLVGGSPAAAFSSVCIDSRTVTPGALFVACRGAQQDGHTFVGEALERGAAGALVSRLPNGEPWCVPALAGGAVVLVPDTLTALQDLARWWRRQHAVPVIGVTGSVGKTTTKEVIAQVLSQDRAVLGSRGNLNTEYGLPMCLMELGAEHATVVLEMGMHALGDIRCLADVAEPNIGVVTNVQPVHLERLGTIERIADAKAELVEALPATGLAVLNADDARVAAMAARTPAHAFTYGFASTADIWADDVNASGLSGVAFTAHCDGERVRAKTNLLGAHSVYAALAAVAVATHLGVAFAEAVSRLERVEQGVRQVVVPGISGSTIVDDSYNASPSSVLAALDLLERTPGRRVAVLGDMLELGSYETEGHRLVGRRAAEVADWLLTVGPRAREIAATARAQGMSPETIETFDRDEDAAGRLTAGLQPGDVVLVKGSRSMHLDRVVDAIRSQD
jgi:UDP-N-acetylmuramoyl-tripeptide--D-alanyl-D-alanine ligase